jgi:type 1 glutamine amidotransferase
VVKRKGNELSHSEKILTELGQKAGFDVVCTKDGSVFDGDLNQYDAIAFYTSGVLTNPDRYKNPPMTPKGKQRLLDTIAAGKGFVAFHSASDSFHSKGPNDENQAVVDPYLAMLGGEFIVHGKQQESTMRITGPGTVQWVACNGNAAGTAGRPLYRVLRKALHPRRPLPATLEARPSPKFPGTEELGDTWRLIEEWYCLKNFASDLHVILVQDTAGMEGPMYQRAPFPATWARMHQQGRVFYTSFGHREDIWTNPKVQQLILGGLAWAMRNVQADVTPNIDQVTPQARVIPKLPPKKVQKATKK